MFEATLGYFVTDILLNFYLLLECASVCVCVYERMRERERESVCVCVLEKDLACLHLD